MTERSGAAHIAHNAALKLRSIADELDDAGEAIAAARLGAEAGKLIADDPLWATGRLATAEEWESEDGKAFQAWIAANPITHVGAVFAAFKAGRAQGNAQTAPMPKSAAEVDACAKADDEDLTFASAVAEAATEHAGAAMSAPRKAFCTGALWAFRHFAETRRAAKLLREACALRAWHNGDKATCATAWVRFANTMMADTPAAAIFQAGFRAAFDAYKSDADL